MVKLERKIFLGKNIGWDAAEEGEVSGGAILPYVLGDDLAGAVGEVEVEEIGEQRHGGRRSAGADGFVSSSSTGGRRKSKAGEVFRWQPR
jgi:hypothetical protein